MLLKTRCVVLCCNPPSKPSKQTTSATDAATHHVAGDQRTITWQPTQHQNSDSHQVAHMPLPITACWGRDWGKELVAHCVHACGRTANLCLVPSPLSLPVCAWLSALLTLPPLQEHDVETQDVARQLTTQQHRLELHPNTVSQNHGFDTITQDERQSAPVGTSSSMRPHGTCNNNPSSTAQTPAQPQPTPNGNRHTRHPNSPCNLPKSTCPNNSGLKTRAPARRCSPTLQRRPPRAMTCAQ